MIDRDEFYKTADEIGLVETLAEVLDVLTDLVSDRIFDTTADIKEIRIALDDAYDNIVGEGEDEDE